MFVTNVITVWVEALQQLFDSDYIDPELRGITIGTNYPQKEVEFPNIWVNFSVNGDVSNAGIGHTEQAMTDEGIREFFRWTFHGTIEFVIGAMGNLERALLLDSVARAIAVGRDGENDEGDLRHHVTQSDLVGMVATWEEFTIGGMNETLGTPWGTDDVIYEATISLNVEGEVVLDPKTGVLIPLSAVNVEALAPGEGDPPVVTGGPAVGEWV